MKRNGGSSGNSHDASTGSGGWNSRIGRGGFSRSPCRCPLPHLAALGTLFRIAGEEGPSALIWVDEGSATGALIEARSGMWLSRASMRDTAARPRRLPSRSSSAETLFAPSPAQTVALPPPLSLPRLRGRVRVGAGQADLLGTQPLDRKGGEDHVLDAEPGVDRSRSAP